MAKAKPVTGLDAQPPTGKNARILAKARLDELYDWGKYVDEPYRVRELHDLRIAAKRLRYTLEIFENVLPEYCKDAVAELQRLQDELGALHDSDVMIALLRMCLSNNDPGYDSVLTVNSSKGKGRFLVNPGLVAVLLDPKAAPSAQERYGLERLLQQQQEQRDRQYDAFRRHWYDLQARDFRRNLLEILETEAVAV
jgi:inorganic triphosphatase YgiF